MTEAVRYPIAPDGIFWSIQGEGHLRGFQMGFCRLAGCSVGCPGCDTDYSVAEKLTLQELAVRFHSTFAHDRDQWVWVTGGEPTDHDLRPLLGMIKGMGMSTAVATSGVARLIPPVDWLSVSPHSSDPAKFQQRYGNEVKLIDGLNGLDMEEWASAWDTRVDFLYRYVQPASTDVGCRTCGALTPCGHKAGHRWSTDPASLERCLAFLRKRPRWALSRQDHHEWAVR